MPAARIYGPICVDDGIWSLVRSLGCMKSRWSSLVKLANPLELRRATSLITRLSASGNLDAASHLLFSLPATDTAAWNALISGCATSGRADLAFRLFDEMLLHGPRPDAFTLSSLLKASANGCLQETQIIHGVAMKMGFSSNAFVITGLLDNYSKAGELCLSEKCFEESSILDSVVWTAMISAYARNGEYDSARGIFIEMWKLGLGLNPFCLASVLSAMTDEECDVRKGEQIHCLSLKMGFLSGCLTPLSNVLLSVYCKCGSKNEAYHAFREIKEPDVVSWTTLLGALDGLEALELFRFLFSAGMDINEYTVINVLSAIDSQRQLILGKVDIG